MRINNVSNVYNSSLKPITNKPKQTNESSFGKALNTLDTNIPSKTNVSKTLDFTNMSYREFSILADNGVIPSHEYMYTPPFPEGGLDLTKDTKPQLEAAMDRKFNYIDFFRQLIDVNKNHQDMSDFSRALDAMENLQGTTFLE